MDETEDPPRQDPLEIECQAIWEQIQVKIAILSAVVLCGFIAYNLNLVGFEWPI